MRILKIIGIAFFGLFTLVSLTDIHSVGDFIFTLIFGGITFLFVKSYLKSKGNQKSSKALKHDDSKVISPKTPSYYQKVYSSGISQIRKMYELDRMPEEFVMLDIETTGFDENYDRILEIGIVHYKNGEKIDSYNQLINPDSLIPDAASRVNGITKEMVVDKPRLYEVIDEVYDRINGKIIAGYNVEFDLKFLGVAFARSKKKIDRVEVFDVLDLVKQSVGSKETPNRKLDTIKKHFGIENTGHRALSDCESTFEVMKKCLKIRGNFELQRQADQLDKLSKLNDNEKLFINTLEEKLEDLGVREKLSYNVMSDRTINFQVDNMQIGRVKLNGRKHRMQILDKDNVLWLDIEGVDEALNNIKHWMKYTKYLVSDEF